MHRTLFVLCRCFGYTVSTLTDGAYEVFIIEPVDSEIQKMKRRLMIKRNLRRKEKNSINEIDDEQDMASSKVSMNKRFREKTLTIISRKKNQASLGPQTQNKDFSASPLKKQATNASLIDSSSSSEEKKNSEKLFKRDSMRNFNMLIKHGQKHMKAPATETIKSKLSKFASLASKPMLNMQVKVTSFDEDKVEFNITSSEDSSQNSRRKSFNINQI